MLSQAPTLDPLGVFARTVDAAALIADCLFGEDPKDPATRLTPAPRLFETAGSRPPVTPAFALVRQPAWQTASSEMHDGFGELAETLGELCDEVDLPEIFGEGLRLSEVVQLAELSKSFHRYEQRGRDQLSEEMQKCIDDGRQITARDYLAALDWPRLMNDALGAIFSRYDAILTPAAPGPAPESLASTGSAVFNALWTFCGTPAVTLPLLQAESGLPMGVQLVGRRGDDGRLLRTAQWLIDFLAEAE